LIATVSVSNFRAILPSIVGKPLLEEAIPQNRHPYFIAKGGYNDREVQCRTAR